MSFIKTYKFPLAIFALLVIYSSAVFSVQLVQGDQKTNDVTKKTVLSAKSDNTSVEVKEGTSSAKVNIENSTPPNQSGTGSSGVCKVTRNGVVTYVPSNQVNVNETGPGDKNVKVECNNSTSQSNESDTNNNSVNSNINVHVKTSN